MSTSSIESAVIDASDNVIEHDSHFGGSSIDNSSVIDDAGAGNFFIFAAVPSWLISMVLHVIALLILVLLRLPLDLMITPSELTLGKSDLVEIEEEMPVFEIENPDITDVQLDTLTEPNPIQPDTDIISEEDILSDANDLESVAMQQTITELGIHSAVTSDLNRDIGGTSDSGLTGRGQASRSRLLREAGGNSESEKAVRLALKWFLRHQFRDGSWSFDHGKGQCGCPDKGTHEEAINAATAMALLPFLGAGHTHKDGKYRKEIEAGLYFLFTRQQVDGSFVEPKGNLYSHGLCTITLSEAYAMTRDPALLRPTQAALNYIAYAQDPVGGGWRYVAKQPGDTSVVGWQLMALKSGKMAYLDVDNRVFLGAKKFLDFVQTDDGAAYGYKEPGNRVAMTAIATLCRMYMGWDREHPSLQRAVERISKSGPSEKDMYYNYYATQVMRHYEGEKWKRWNKRMRDFLVSNQEQKGHKAGSWQMGATHAAKAGGRLYNTSLATMVLEVYYRHLPIYRQQATEDDFEL